MAAPQQQQSIFAATIAYFMTQALNTFYCRGALGTRLNPDTIACVLTGEFDLNALRVDGEKETVADSKISRHVWTVP